MASQDDVPDAPPPIFDKELSLADQALQNLSEAISDFEKLVHLDLNSNHLSDLPTNFHSLTDLEVLNLSHNNFKVMPSVLFDVTQLRELNMSHNEIETVPSDIQKLTMLTTLNLSWNRLETISDELANLPSLSRLDISGNTISSIHVVRLKNLTYLNVGSNPMIHTAHVFLHKNNNLTGLNVSGIYSPGIATDSFIQHSVLKPLGEFRDIRELNLSELNLSELPDVVFQLPRLSELYLAKNNLSEIRIRSAESIPLQLCKIDLQFNKFTSVPSSLSSFPALLHINVSHNGLKTISQTGSCNAFYKLESLILSNNDLSDIPEDMSNFPALKVFDLKANNFTAIPASLASLENLDQVCLSSNVIVNDEIHQIPLEGIKSLDISNNMLTDISKYVRGLPDLEALDVNGNKLQCLPGEIGTLSHLSSLDLGRNEILHLPSGIGGLQVLRTLILSENKLTTLPDDITKLQNLERLHVNGNCFSEFPESVLGLRRLKQLDISENQLTELPHDMSALTSLAVLNVGKNRLSCNTISNVATVRNLVVLHADENAIENIPSALVLRLPSLMVINLDKNDVTYQNPKLCSAGIDWIREYTKYAENLQRRGSLAVSRKRRSILRQDTSERSMPLQEVRPLQHKYAIWKIRLDKNEDRVVTKFMERFTIEFPPKCIKSTLKLEMATIIGTDLMTGITDYECVESDIIAFSRPHTSFVKPITLGYRLTAYDDSREVVFLRCDDGKHWHELQTYIDKSTGNSVAKTEIKDVSMFVVISKPYKEKFKVGKNGIIYVSNDQIRVEIPPDALTKETTFNLMVIKPNPDIVADVQQMKATEAKAPIYFGPMVSLVADRRGGANELAKPATLIIPVPETHTNNLHILQENEDGNDWDDITDEVSRDSDKKVISIPMKTLSRIMPVYSSEEHSPGDIASTTQELNSRQTEQIHTVSIILLQSTRNCFEILVDVVECRSILEKVAEHISHGYKTSGSVWSIRDIDVKSLGSITVTAGGDFELDVGGKTSVYLTFVPHNSNHRSQLRMIPREKYRQILVGTQLKGFVEFTSTQMSERIPVVIDVTKDLILPGSVPSKGKQDIPDKKNSFLRIFWVFLKGIHDVFEAKMTTFSSHRPRDKEFDRIVQVVSENIDSGSWRSFGRLLGISDRNIDNIDETYDSLDDKKYYLLSKWKKQNGSAATLERLAAIAKEFQHVKMEEELRKLADQNVADQI